MQLQILFCRAVKTMLAEACKPTEQARGMAILSLGWGMGSTLGPMLGGSLASPCDRFPDSFLCHEGSIFAARCDARLWWLQG